MLVTALTNVSLWYKSPCFEDRALSMSTLATYMTILAKSALQRDLEK